MERISRVLFFDGTGIREFDNAQCEFRYRESVFKRHKDWIIFSAELEMEQGEAAVLRATADEILAIRNRKYPPTMKCAGSIFKNFLLAELPARVVEEIPPKVIIEGKVPSAWFLEQVGAKGMKAGDIHVADYHANLIYNAGCGTARELAGVIAELKQRIERAVGHSSRRRGPVRGLRRRSRQYAKRRARGCHNLGMRLLTRSGALITFAVSLALAGDMPTGDSLLQRYIDRSGGAEAYAKAKNMSMTGTVEIEGRNISGDVAIFEEGEKSWTAMEFAGYRKDRRGL